MNQQATSLNPSMTPLEWACLLLLSVAWGGSFFFVAVALRDLPPFTIVFARLLFGALGLLAVLACTGTRLPLNRRILLGCLCLGLLNNAVPFSLLTWGQVQLASGVAAVLNATTPLFTLVIAHAFTADEKITPGRLLGIGLGILGVAAMLAPDFGSGAGFRLLASVACLGAAFSYGCAVVYARRLLASGVPLLGAAAGQVLAAALLLLPVMLLADRPWSLPVPQAGSWAALVAIGLLSTTLAYLLYFRILSTAGATNLSLVTLLVPASAVLLGAGILGERLQPHQLAGMALIGLGLLAIDGRLWRRLAGFAGRGRRP